MRIKQQWVQYQVYSYYVNGDQMQLNKGKWPPWQNLRYKTTICRSSSINKGGHNDNGPACCGPFLLKEFSKLLVLHTILLQYIRFNINLIKP